MSIRDAALLTRLLVLMPTSKDVERAAALFHSAGLEPAVCTGMTDLCREIRRGAGAVLLTDDALSLDEAGQLAELVHAQPAWSSLPFVMLAREGASDEARDRACEALTNLTIVERPARTHALISLLSSALRGRQHQYVIRDALQQSESALVGQAEQLRCADRRKDEFLATLAHELRNPLAPIRTGMDLLHVSDAESQRTVDMIRRQLGHMVRLIDDLLDVSRITRGKLELKRTRVALTEVVELAVESSRPLIDRHGHVLSVVLPSESLILDVDLTRIAQALGNLLNNASKYTPAGGVIELSAERDGDEAVIRVRDNGAGIPVDQLENIFQMFSQVNRQLDSSRGGLGIGLALVRQLVEMHRGSVTASSAGPGRGSLLTLRLPLASRQASAAALLSSGAAEPAQSRRILVVDDNDDAAEMLAIALRRAGHRTATACDGPSALCEIESSSPQVVFLDIGLPGMSGYDVARALRSDPRYSAIALIALTGWGSQDDRRKAADAGFDLHLTKPVNGQQLRDALIEVESRRAR